MTRFPGVPMGSPDISRYLRLLLFGSTPPMSWRSSRCRVAGSSPGLEVFHLLYRLYFLQSFFPKGNQSGYDWVRNWGERSLRGHSACMWCSQCCHSIMVGVMCLKGAFLGSWQEEAVMSLVSSSTCRGWAGWRAMPHSLDLTTLVCLLKMQ